MGRIAAFFFLEWKFNLFSQVSSEEEQEKPGNFIQGKPRMSLVGKNLNQNPTFFIYFEYRI